MQPHTQPSRSAKSGFSLIELMVSMTILTAILLLFVGLLDQTQKTWDYSAGQISQFRDARIAFDLITKNLSQATLNSYYEQVDAQGKRVFEFADPNQWIPQRFEIQSELHFINLPADDVSLSGFQTGPGHALFFQAPLGDTEKDDYANLSNLLNARGYFVAFGSDRDFQPDFLQGTNLIPDKKRYRLMEFLPPSEWNEVYIDHADGVGSTNRFNSWYKNGSLLKDYTRPLAENIVALIISPREPIADNAAGLAADRVDRIATQRIAPNYEYDSEDPPDIMFKHLLPPLVKVTMVAIDETSAIRLDDLYDGSPYMTSARLLPGGNWMSTADNYFDDVEGLQDKLNSENLQSNGINVRYKIFSTTVTIHNSKWSPTQSAASAVTP